MNSVRNLLETPFSQRSEEEKLEIKRLGRPVPDLNIVQNISSGSRQYRRLFKSEFYTKTDWLCGCDHKNTLFCFPCLLFGGEPLWTKTGVSDINHLTDRIRKHQTSNIHMKNVMKLALFGTVNIAKQFDSEYRRSIAVHNEKVRNNRYVLNIIINCVRFCGAFELALRGHDESVSSSNPGIFKGLINFSSELDIALKNHIENATVFKGTSKTIQNELLGVMLEVCREKISSEIKESDFLAIISDETSDVSNVFQMAIVFRYIVQGNPVERFWGFFTPQKHDAETLASCILEELAKHKVNEKPNKLIAQTYDGASVMSGSTGGVQAIVKRHYPVAEYVHCHAHQLNLIMMNAASVNRNVRIFFASLQGICTFFSSSPQRTKMLDEIVKKRLPRSVPSRWNFHSRSINTIFLYRKQIVLCMRAILKGDEIKNLNTISQANGHIKTLTGNSFIFWLSFFHEVMPHVEILFGQLQRRDIDPISAKKCLMTFEENVKKIRDKVDELNIDQSSSSSSAKKRRTDNTEVKREAKEVCDVIICHAKDRFSFTGHLIASSLFLSENFPQFRSNFPEDNLKTVCEIYPFLNFRQLRFELSTIYSTDEFSTFSGAVSFHHFIIQNNIESTFSESLKLLKVLLTIPMTTTEAERCFSTLKRIKTFLRNTMGQERLSALAMLSIERELVMNIADFNQRVIDKFAAGKDRRMDFLFK